MSIENRRKRVRRRSLGAAVTAASLALWSMGVGAHDTWLSAEQRAVRAGTSLELLMTSGERFPTLGSLIAPRRIATSACRQGSETLSLKHAKREPKALRLSTKTPTNDPVTCWVQLEPRTLALNESTVAHYLDEIDAPLSVRDVWKAAKAPRRWSETYAKNAKVMVPGALKGPGTAADPVGLKLELVLLKDPAAAPSDGKLPVVVLLDGKPREGLSIALTGEHDGPIQRQRTDAKGSAVFKLPQAGRWMMSATDLVAVDASKGEWESQFSTLVFDIPATSR